MAGMITDELTVIIAAGFIPVHGEQLHPLIEALPEVFRLLAAKLGEFAEWAGGHNLEETGTHLTDMAVHAGTAREAAAEAFLAYQAESAAWRE